jgi:hypothetical protein
MSQTQPQDGTTASQVDTRNTALTRPGAARAFPRRLYQDAIHLNGIT